MPDRNSQTKLSPLEIALVAGEPSGDRLGAGLISQLKTQLPDAHFVGIGGPKMEQAGCEILYQMDRIGVIGLDGLKDKLFDILRIRKSLASRWQSTPPAVFVGVDVPDFNISLEAKLRSSGIPTVHYVSPTVWAWRGYRIHKIKRAVDHMLALFPFEEKFYQHHQVAVTCVGHPLADEIERGQKQIARDRLNVSANTLIALLPGSRRSEVKRLTQPLLDAARRLFRDDDTIQFILPFASDRVKKTFEEAARDYSDLPLTFVNGQSRRVLEAADLAILASGTASLEAALLGTPHVVVYKLSALSYWLMRRLRQVDHYAMPNHLLPSPMVPELIQEDATGDNIYQAAKGYLDSPERMRKIRSEFEKIFWSLKLDADRRAAEVVVSMIKFGDAVN
ncbi:MAG: lipid-A-disaccharide synthase [Acidiferrobacterales bacterium]|nr:lipid-A-disaccharide synthase [Acidiferrobacterales bacterium]